MDNLLIRKAIIEDVSSFAEIQKLAWQCVYRGHLPDEYLNTIDLNEKIEEWKSRLENHEHDPWEIYVAAENEKVIGYIAFGLYRFDSGEDTSGEIRALHVHPNFQRKGIGTKLALFAIDQIRHLSMKKIYVLPLEANMSARAFYSKLGFKTENKVQEVIKAGIPLKQVQYYLPLS